MRLLNGIGVFVAVVLTACSSGGVLSSGAALPQAGLEFKNSDLAVEVDHGCSGGRCSEFSAKFQNLTSNPVEIVIETSKLTRSGQSLALARLGDAKGNISVPPRESVRARFSALGEDGKQRMNYVMPKEVWCSLKVDAACRNPDQGAARCAGFARYYYDTYVSTKGWITVSFGYKTDGRTESIESAQPEFMGTTPSVRVTENDKAPWFISNPDDIVFHKVSCDAKCKCVDLSKSRNYFLDDKFKPILEN